MYHEADGSLCLMSEEPRLPSPPPYSLGVIVQQAKSAAKSLREGSNALKKLSTDMNVLVVYVLSRTEYRDALEDLSAEVQELIESMQDIAKDATIPDALASTTKSLDRALRLLDRVEARQSRQ